MEKDMKNVYYLFVQFDKKTEYNCQEDTSWKNIVV